VSGSESVDASGDLAIGVDVGGTKVAAGLVDARGTVLARAECPTPATAEALDDAVAGVVELVRPSGDLPPVGIATAGLVDPVTGAVSLAVNLPWSGHPVRRALGERLGHRVSVDNDANAAAWAEYRFGAGAGARALVVVTLGTGIGGGIVLDGRLVRGARGAAAEFGHLPLVPDGRACGCGRAGCWERYLSGTAFTAEARARAEALRVAGTTPAPAWVLTEPGEITARAVAAAARDGEPHALAVVSEQGRRLGAGLALVVAALDPDVVVVGGGLSALADLLLGPARAALAVGLGVPEGSPALPELRAAAAGNDAGVVGAADLARCAQSRTK